MVRGTIHGAVGTTACVGTGCVRREGAGLARHLPDAGSRLCSPCRGGLLRDLRQLPGLYEECARQLGGRPVRTGERTSGGPLPGMPFDTRAAEVRSSVLGVLSSWATLVVEERGVTAPRRTVAALAEFLARHADWLSGHRAAAEACEEVARLVRRARRAIDPEPDHRVGIGSCVEPGCPGGLTALLRPERPRLPAEIRCDADPAHRWFGHEWLQLSRRLAPLRASSAAAAGPESGPESGTHGRTAPRGSEPAGHEDVRWVTAADVSRLWAIPLGSVYRHASVRKWRRRSRAGRTYYHGADVDRTLSGRGAAAGNGL